MPNPLVPIDGAVVGVNAVTMILKLTVMTPKTIGLFYVEIAKACYGSTGSRRIVCGVALITGPNQGSFIVACAPASRETNNL